MKNILRLITSGLFSAFVTLAAQAADLAPGAYSAGSVSGSVTFAAAGSSTFLPVTAGMALPQGATIKTGKESSVNLVFSSGSSALVEANTTVEITKFEQQLFSGPIVEGDEPSVSNTEMKIVDGAVIAKVSKLKKGSSFSVNSEVGAAGVRGTKFKVVYNAATRQFTVTTTSGLVITKNLGTGTETATSESEKTTINEGAEAVKEEVPAEVIAAIEAVLQAAVDGVTPPQPGTVLPTIEVGNDEVDITISKN